MPTSTYDLIASNVLTSSASSVTFSSLPSSYRDLILVTNVNTTATNSGYEIRFNNDSGSNYSIVTANRENGSIVSSSGTFGRFIFSTTWGNLTNNEFSMAVFQFMDYSATDKHKTILTRMGNQNRIMVGMIAGRWANTAAINTVTCSEGTGGSFVSGSSFYLYGIAS